MRQAAQRILECTAEPLRLPEAQVRIDLTVGICLFPDHGDDAETLLRRAEIAMYSARSAGRAIDIYADRARTRITCGAWACSASSR